MRTTGIVTAQVEFDDAAAPHTAPFRDAHPLRHGTFAQAQEVFMAGNGLPARWQRRPRFTVLETGFGGGNNFLATWAAWRADPARCERLCFVSIEQHPLTRADLERAHFASPAPELARELIDAWPAATCNLHTLDFDAGRVRLLLALGDIRAWARELVARVDAFYLGGSAPAHRTGMWDRGVFSMLTRLAAPGATAATGSAAATVREALRRAGFAVQLAADSDSTRDVTLARFAPRHTPPAPPGRAFPAQAPRCAVVIGGGLAGAFTARALARQGIACTVLDRHAEPAAEASGNPAGLFHGAVMGHDGPHARLLRAAALASEVSMRAAVARGVPGRIDGLLRLESKLPLAAMQDLLDRQALPRSYVQALSAASASAHAGVTLPQAAWFYPGGGWADPGALVRDALVCDGVTWRGGSAAHRIARCADTWQVFDATDALIASAPQLVLANGADALRLAGLPPHWLQRQRGQISWGTRPTAMRPKVPIASGGYVLTLPDGCLLFGATHQPDDSDPGVREADHRENVAKAARLIGAEALGVGEALHGRVGWRAAAPDRLPLMGAAPDLAAAPPARADAARLLPRQPGLWLHTGLGSRGLTTVTLLAELLAAQISGAPWPLEADLVDAIDPARWRVRA